MKTGNLNGVDLTSDGGGTNYLADDGTYKAVSGGSQDLQSVLTEGNIADNGVIVTNTDDNAPFSGLTSIRGTAIDDVRYATMVQLSAFTQLIAGYAGGSGSGRANYFDIKASDDTGTEISAVKIKHNNVEILQPLEVDGIITALSAFQQDIQQTNYNVISRLTTNLSPALYTNQAGSGPIQAWTNDPTSVSLNNEVAKIENDGSFSTEGTITADIPTGTQVGLVGYDANGKLIQGTSGGSQDLQSVLDTGNIADNGIVIINDQTGAENGFSRFYGTGTDFSGKKYVGINQNAVFADLVAGSASAGLNKLRILIADSASNEQQVAEFGDTLCEFLVPVEFQDDLVAEAQILSLNISSDSADGLVSVWGTADPLNNKGYASLKQFSTWAELRAGWANGAASNELRVLIADSGGVEQQVATFKDDAVEVDVNLDLEGILNLASTTNGSPSDGDVWRDSSDGKLKFRENGVTYNFN